MSVNTVFIYGLNDPTTGRCRYLGKAVDPHRRFGNHLLRAGASNTHKNCWIRGLVVQGLKPVLEVLDEVPASEWVLWEREYIRVFRMVGVQLTNLTDGGEGVVGLTEESREKLSAAHKGKKFSEETREKMRTSRTGKKLSAETRAKISTSNSGKKRTIEARSRMSNAHLGKPLSKQHLLSISLGRERGRSGA